MIPPADRDPEESSSAVPLEKGKDVLRIRDFRLLLLIKFLATFGMELQAVVVAWQIYQLTKDPLALGLVGLSEALAFICFALWAGHLADQSEKRIIVRSTLSALVGCSLVLWGMTHQGNPRVLWIYSVIAVTGLARSFLWSASTSFMEQAVPREIYSRAAAWNSTAWEIAAITGPAAGGLLYAFQGPKFAYGTAAFFLFVALLLTSQLGRRPPVIVETKDPARTGLFAGARFIFNHPVILGALTLDMIAVLFGGAVAILPIFADRLGVGPKGLGFLRAAPSVGALLMAFYQAHHPPFRQTGRTLLKTVSLFGLFMIAFALSRNFYLSLFLLAASGMADNISVVIRASILQASTPNDMRGRVSAVNGIFIGSSNEIGAFESGLAAKLMGTVPSVVFGGAMTLITVVWIGWKFPRLRRLQSISEL